MIARDLPPKFGSLLATSPQIGRAKSNVGQCDDAECFQRLTAGEQLEAEANNRHAQLQNRLELEVNFSAPLAVQCALLPLNFIAESLAAKGEQVIAFGGETDLPDLKPISKKLTQMVGLMWLKVSNQASQNEPQSAVKAKAKLDHFDLPKDENSQKFMEPVVQKFGAGSAAETITHMIAAQQHPPVSQIPSLRIADLPHITRVHIDHTKRNASGALSSLELVLEPAELGRITAKLQHEEGRITLILSAEREQIAQDLMRDSSMLIRALEGYIPNVRSIEISIQAEARQAIDFQQFGQAHWHAKGQDRKQHSDSPGIIRTTNIDAPAEASAPTNYPSKLYLTI